MAQANQPDSYDDELSRIDASIADLKIQDMAAAKTRTEIASKIQAAQFQRDILAHANTQKKAKGPKARRARTAEPPPPPPGTSPPPGGAPPRDTPRRETPPRSAKGPQPAGAPPWAASATPASAGVATDGNTLLVDDPPPTEKPPPPRRPPAGPPGHQPHQPHPPEASSQSVQNILLVLGALLLGVAAVVFATVAVTNPVTRGFVLLLFTAIALVSAPWFAKRDLSSTAETVSAVGLVLLPVSLYALHDSSLGLNVSAAVYLGVTFMITAVAGFVYAGVTRLNAPRYATVIAVQPVPPLLAYPWIEGPAGWGLALAIVALLDLLLLTTVIRTGRLVPRWPIRRPAPGDREDLAEADEARAAAERDFLAQEEELRDRPESQPEEPDLIIDGLAPKRRWWRPTRIFPGPRPVGAPAAGTVPLEPPATPPSADWLRELTFALLCAAVAGSLLYAGGALIGADAVSHALRSGLLLVLAAAIAVAAAWLLDNITARNIAGAVLTLAVIGASARIAAVADPRWTLLVAAAAVACTGAVVGNIPLEVRRGPQLASAAALTLIGLLVAVDALRAALAPVQAARPVWDADTAAYAGRIAEAAGPSGWLLAVSALLLTFAAALALPAEYRYEGAVVGVALTALSVPASFGLPWSTAPWPLVIAAIGIGAFGMRAPSRRAAYFHVGAAGVVGLFGAGAALSATWLTAAVLTAIAGAGVMVAIAARQIPAKIYSWVIGDWASGAAALALPGAAVTAVLAVADPGGGPPATEDVTVPALAIGFLAVAGTLTYAAVFQVARREISLPLTAGAGLGAVALALAALLAPGATAPDIWVGALLLASAGLLFFAKSLDNGRRADRMLDGPDIAAAGATVAICGALARVAALAFPNAPLVVAALVVLAVGLGVRALPDDWRRGPVRGLAVAGLVVGLIAAWLALGAGLRILAAPGPLWASDVSGYPGNVPDSAWQAPIALLFIAIAAAAALPPPHSFNVGAICAALAAVGAPAAFGLPWWSPLLVGGAVTLGYAVAAVAAWDPRAAYARTAVAVVVALHFTAVGLVRPWSTAMAMLLIVLTGLLVAIFARAGGPAFAPAEETDADATLQARDDTGMPRHRGLIGGAATFAVLLALPGVFAALAAGEGRNAQIVLTAALAASALSLAVVCTLGKWIPQYLPWATFGLVAGATVTAVASIPSDYPTALYAAAAALLGVIAELLRGATQAPGLTVAPDRYWVERRRWTELRPSGLRGRWLVDPATGAVIVAIVPTLLALVSLGPALAGALFDPFQQLSAIWQGPVAELVNPGEPAVDGTSVLAALLLTVAAALAALGFGGKASESVPVILPGLAITLLVAPVGLDLAWPASTSAALVVFTVAMLGLALTPPPIATRAPLLRATRVVVFAIGLMAGGAGLAGALATKPLTLFTLGAAVGVGLVAALAGRTAHARILGWLFTVSMGQGFVLTGASAAGLDRTWAAFGVLAVGAGLLMLEASMPRLGLPQYRREAVTVEWSGYASAVLAGLLAFDSPEHLAALFAAWGAVMGLTATRPDRTARQRRNLFWLAVAFEVVGWWLFMTLSDVALPEAYTLPFAALALAVGIIEARNRPELSSWAAYGPALLAAFVPTVGIVLTTDGGALREVLLLCGAVGTLIVGAQLKQQAPVVVGAAVTVIAAIHFAMTLVGPWLVLVPLGAVLLVLGATNESRRRTQERVRGALTRMR
ncbi:SCO7613 C-terminal domain-containing membrane protein [Actinoplanes sp. NPDC049265]|uniref:SCO7613 C-terminal domain-containing membrane protein n=1 Tax=Actinoplanes sp. NPDC049265 TaxID=3363902 RepID=UPI0037133945